MENFAAIALAESLKAATGDIIIRRVIQHQPAGFIFQTRSNRLPALKILMDARHPAIYSSEAKLPVETPPSDFLMTLRKHLTSAEIAAFNKPLSERVVEIVFKTAVPSRELETMTLVLELIPNAPNMILLDAERRVLASFFPLSPQHQTGQFDAYAPPPAGEGKIDLERFLNEEVDLSEYAAQASPAQWLISHVAGIGPVFAAEVVHRERRNHRPVVEEIRDILRQAMAPRAAWLYTRLPLGHILDNNDLESLGRAVISPIELHSMERSASSRQFPSMVEAARFYFDELENRAALERAKLPALRGMRVVAKRLADREKKIEREQRRYDDAEAVQRNAQTLVSGGMNPDQRYDRVTVTDYFGDEPQPVTIELDQALTLRENIDKMFRLAEKAARGKPVAARQLEEVRQRRAGVAEQLRRLQAIKDWDTWLAVSTRLGKGSQPNQRRAMPEGSGSRRRFRSAIIDGCQVFVGRSSRENDEITFEIAGPNDFWLHVADYTGSHVVVRNPEGRQNLDEGILVKAAQVAAYYSQARNSSKVEVRYTRRKNVVKPRKAKPGMVRLMEFKSIEVEPKNWMD
ncbi:MAG TPA: NFACT family protein [Terriglobia bacterium]|nr:NFACT family protein [Terriglobia bacterium]